MRRILGCVLCVRVRETFHEFPSGSFRNHCDVCCFVEAAAGLPSPLAAVSRGFPSPPRGKSVFRRNARRLLSLPARRRLFSLLLPAKESVSPPIGH